MNKLSELFTSIIIAQIVLVVLAWLWQAEMSAVLALYKFSAAYALIISASLVLVLYIITLALKHITRRRAGQRNDAAEVGWK